MPSMERPQALNDVLPFHRVLDNENCKSQSWEHKLREAKPGGFQTGGVSHFFSGKVQIVSRTLSGLFLVGALNGPRKRKGTNRENPQTIPEQIGKIPEKSGKSLKGQKRAKKEVNAHGSTPTPGFLTWRDETQTMVRAKTQTKSQTTPDSVFTRERRKLRPWCKFLGRENSDHGLNFGLPRGGGRSCLLVARAIRNAIRAYRFARIIRNWNPYFCSASGRFARITRFGISDSRESPDSRESCESIRANHAAKSCLDEEGRVQIGKPPPFEPPPPFSGPWTRRPTSANRFARIMPSKYSKLTLRAQRLKKFKILKFSSEVDNFKRAAHQTPIFVGNSEGRDWKIQARLKFSSARLKISIENGFFFNLWALGEWG